MTNMRKVYMDNNATTRTREEVVAAMLPYFEEIYGNASSIHQFGRAARTDSSGHAYVSGFADGSQSRVGIADRGVGSGNRFAETGGPAGGFELSQPGRWLCQTDK